MILILTTEPLPYPGMVTTGAGLRAWALAQGLKARGVNNVAVAMPRDFLHGLDDTAKQQITDPCYDRNNLAEIINRLNPDVLVLQHWGLAKNLPDISCPLAIDLAGPHLLERYYWGEQNLPSLIEEKLAALRRADFLTCSGHNLRYYFLPFILLAGYELAPAFLPVIPISYAPELPEDGERDRTSFVYGGMFLPWQDPAKPLGWAIEALHQTGKGKLHFYGGPHPLVDVSKGKFFKLVEDLEKAPQVVMHSIVPFDTLLQEYQLYGVAIELMEKNLERELAFTTRTIIYMWCGLPVIYNNYSELSNYIERFEAGWTLSPQDERGIKELIQHLLNNPQEIRRRGKNAQRLVKEYFNWERTIEPLAHFCQHPGFRKGKEQILLRTITYEQQLQRIKAELKTTQRELNTLRGKKIFKLYERLRSMGFIIAPFVFLFGIIISIVLTIGLSLADLIGSTGYGKKNLKP